MLILEFYENTQKHPLSLCMDNNFYQVLVTHSANCLVLSILSRFHHVVCQVLQTVLLLFSLPKFIISLSPGLDIRRREISDQLKNQHSFSRPDILYHGWELNSTFNKIKISGLWTWRIWISGSGLRSSFLYFL